MLRFGLCCQFLDAPIKFRTTTATYLKKRSYSKNDFLSQLIFENAQSLEQAILHCSEIGIGSFRINSQFFPVYTHPEEGYQLDELPHHQQIKSQLSQCKQLIKDLGMRLTFHPDQFVVLSTPHVDVLEKSIAELEYQAHAADLVGADVINIHAGGRYGDKKAALARFVKAFQRLSLSAQQKLTLENDDKSYSPKDLLALCRDLDIPFVYDVHHHRCLPDGLSIDEVTDQALKTWNREPLFHLSSPLNGWGGMQLFKHHGYIDVNDFPRRWLEIDRLTIEIEAKAKERAILKLIQDLRVLKKNAQGKEGE